jgi:signal transduction protein with GAF and PtsI domain
MSLRASHADLERKVETRTRELARLVSELRALGDVSQAVNSTLALQNVLTTIVAKAVQLSGTDAGSIYVLDHATQEFVLRATHGMNEEMIAELCEQKLTPNNIYHA